MKLLRELLSEVTRLPDPSDYRSGDKDLPGSPYYSPKFGSEMDDPNDEYHSSRDKFDTEEEWRTKRDHDARQQHQAKLTDVKITQEPNPSGAPAPMKVETGIAIDRETAKREMLRIERLAWKVHHTNIEELPDGRCRYTIKYVS